jgi:nanoRNase/pAp phosphatase (c-di-AMP/oligoRNAs hydrolase)
MLSHKINSFLNDLRGKKTKNKKHILITTHKLADLDGVASSFALNFFLTTQFQDLFISLYFSGVSQSAKHFIERISQKFPEFDPPLIETFDLTDIDAFFIVDTNKLKNIESFLNLAQKQKQNSRFFFIDHHFSKRTSIKDQDNIQGIFLDEYSSTCEIICELFWEFEIPIPEYIRYLLAAGILTDSGHLKYANNRTIQIISHLLSNDLDFQEIRSMLKREIDVSERIARIKGAQRVKLKKVGKWLIGISYVSSFEASVARILLKLGFDIAFVISERKKENRVSLRAKKKVCRETGLHLGKMLESLSNKYDANGGGHDGAASINIAKKEGTLKQVLINQIEKILLKSKN